MKPKPKKSASKRFKVTGTGKVLRKKAFKSHLLVWKSSKRKRLLRKKTVVHATQEKKIRTLLGH